MSYRVRSNDSIFGHQLWFWCVTLTKFVLMMILDLACIVTITFDLGIVCYIRICVLHFFSNDDPRFGMYLANRI